MEVSFNIRPEFLEKTKEQAKKDSIELFGDGSGKEYLRYQDLNVIPSSEIEYDKDSDKISLSGDITDSDGNNFGTMDIGIPLNLDVVLGILEVYIKKFNKLKTVLEATKD